MTDTKPHISIEALEKAAINFARNGISDAVSFLAPHVRNREVADELLCITSEKGDWTLGEKLIKLFGIESASQPSSPLPQEYYHVSAVRRIDVLRFVHAYSASPIRKTLCHHGKYKIHVTYLSPKLENVPSSHAPFEIIVESPRTEFIEGLIHRTMTLPGTPQKKILIIGHCSYNHSNVIRVEESGVYEAIIALHEEN